MANLRARLEAAGLRPNIRLGQNFLMDANLARCIVRESGLAPGDVALEVGPGTGFLTRRLAETGARILAVELDRGLAAFAVSEMAAYPNVTVLQADILDGRGSVNPEVPPLLESMLAEARRGAAARPPALLCVSNLPYSAGTPFVMELLSSPLPWSRGVFLLQREVARRMAAAPDQTEYGALSIGCALAGPTEAVRRISPGVFWPRPRVDSALAIARYRPAAERTALPWAALRKVTRAVFGARRKKLRNALHASFPDIPAESWLARTGLDPETRGETLTPGQFLSLARTLENGSAGVPDESR